jgi:astacin
MIKRTLAILTVTLTALLSAAPSAKGPDSGSLTNAALIRVPYDAPVVSDAFASGKSIAQISSEELPAFNESADGTRFMLLRFQSEGASAVRAHFKAVHVPAGSRFFVYGVDANGAATVVHGPFAGAGPLQTGEFWSPALNGDQIVVEFQVDGDTPAVLPFEVDRIADVDAENILQTNAVAAADNEALRTSKYKGLSLMHAVRDGLAIYEDDILLGQADDLAPADTATSKNREHEGVGTTLASSRWPSRVVPYVIDPSLPNQSRVTAAIAAWNTALNGLVRIVPRTSEPGYMVFSSYPSTYQCYSPVGYIGGGPQTTYLGDGCATGNVIHEIGHQLGLWHEHTRADRNSYVSVLYQNIDPGSYYNFNQNTWNSMDIGGYDYGSIMHYSAYAFSINGQPTIVTNPAGITIGQRDHLSTGDINAVVQMYGGVVQTAPQPQPQAQSVSVVINGNPQGTRVVVDGTMVGLPYTVMWAVGSTHTLSGADVGLAGAVLAKFSNWSDGGAATHTITVTSSTTTFTANFALYYPLTTGVSPGGTGSVTVSPDSSYIAAGTTVTLTATPVSGYCFASWTGLIGGTGPQATVTMTAPLSVTANFTACAAPPPVVTSSVFTPIRVKAGGAGVWDARGQFWAGDYAYDSGNTYGSNYTVRGTDSPGLYSSERWSSSPFSYSFNVPNGTYKVTLKFAEIWFPVSGYRIFNVAINGQTVMYNFDPAAAAGGSFAAVDRTFTTNVTNGQIGITMIPIVSNPKISAIEITQ